MPSWMTILRDIVWTAVGSVVTAVTAIVVGALTANVSLTVALAGTSIALAILSQRD